jgi:amidohydrolase
VHEAITDFEPIVVEEDLSLLLQRAPVAFAWIGAVLEPVKEHHHARFDIDESALVRGASTLAATALRMLREIHSRAPRCAVMQQYL